MSSPPGVVLGLSDGAPTIPGMDPTEMGADDRFERALAVYDRERREGFDPGVNYTLKVAARRRPLPEHLLAPVEPEQLDGSDVLCQLVAGASARRRRRV